MNSVYKVNILGKHQYAFPRNEFNVIVVAQMYPNFPIHTFAVSRRFLIPNSISSSMTLSVFSGLKIIIADSGLSAISFISPTQSIPFICFSTG